MSLSEKSSNGNHFKADFKTLSPSLQESIKKIIKRENFREYEVIVKNLSANGENYLGIAYEITVDGRTAEGGKEISFFVKQKLRWRSTSFINCDQLYEYEVLMYKDISKVMNALQDEANVPPDDRFKLAIAYEETNEDAIILENLCKKGYVRSDRHETSPLKFFQLGVEELAKLHAMSLVIQKRKPKYFNDKIEGLKPPFTFNEDFNTLMKKVCTHLASLYENETKVKLQKLQSFIINNFQEYYSEKTSVRTLCHGDYRKSNCMVRVKNGELTDVIIIDYQIMDCGCPVRDLILMIIFDSNQEFRKKHFNDLKELYFDKMTNFLKYFDIDVETVFPREEFDRLCSEFMKHALIMFLYFSVFFVTEDSYDMKKLMLSDLPYHPGKDAEKIVRDLIDDFVELGYL